MIYLLRFVQVFFFIVIGAVSCSALGEDVKCICFDNDEVFITTMAGKTLSDDEVNTPNMKNQIMDRLDMILNSLTTVPGENLIIQYQNSTKYNRFTSIYPRSCAEATANNRRSGIYSIQDGLYGPQPFKVSCEEELYGGGWTVVLRRKDGTIDFYRNFTQYQYGFGNIEGEFFIGLDKLFALTNGPYTQEVIFVLEDFDNVRKYAKYSSFAIGNENEKYVLKVLGTYSGDAGDSLKIHAGQHFKTKDVEDPKNCAKRFTGAWWYNDCHTSNLCGKYLSGAYGSDKFAQGVVWKSFRGHNYSLKLAMMMIRPQRT